MKQNSSLDFLKFIIPSMIGVFLFIVPIPYQDEMTIPVAILAKMLEGFLTDYIPAIVTIVIGITLLGSLISKIFKPDWIRKSNYLTKLFEVGYVWLFFRAAGFIFVLMTLMQWGPEWIWSDVTGGLLLTGLIPLLFTIFIFAGLFLPLLLSFGLLELFSALLTKVMRPLFKLPGRSSIDALASWVGDGTVGVILTNKQYEDGYYSQREAAVIGTTFSVVSLTFSIVVLAEIGLSHLFLPYYMTIVFTGLILAIVMPRIPPLSRKPDTYYKEVEGRDETDLPESTSLFQWGLSKAVNKAKLTSTKEFVKGGVQNAIDMVFGVLPIVMAIGTISLIIAEYTSFFRWLGLPFVPILTFMQVPEAAEAAQTMLVGFADMFLPAILGSGIESEMTRFIIACLSVVQLIYMSEVGGIILGSKLPVRFRDLAAIFLLRTIIALPIIVLIAHMIF
jgi:nucleoside recognition membrane protein YjiH